MLKIADKVLKNKPLESSEVVDGFVDNIVFGNKIEDLSKYVHEDVLINSVSGVRGQGYEAHKKALSVWNCAFKNRVSESLCSMEKADEFIHHWSVKALHVKPFHGMEASGQEVHFKGVTLYKVRDGKIASISGYSDFGRDSIYK